MGKVLIIDDDDDLRKILRDVLKEEGFSAAEAKDGFAGVKAFRSEVPAAVLLDMKMPYMDGIETLRELNKIDSQVPVIVMTAYGDVPNAVEAMKAGAYDYMLKPPDYNRLVHILRRAVELRVLSLEKAGVDAALNSSLENMFGRSAAMKKVIDQIRQVAQTEFSLIIQGETGTGKSVVAESIKNMSKRSEKPFLCVDIGLIPDHLVESELFGYRKGAFTGAEKDKIGYLETADTGTIFIDELENMSLHVQGKLLTFMERKKIYPLGGTSPVDLDIRIIAATNANMRESVVRKEFREDLFYRIGEFMITIPPLRERTEDILFFAEKFIFESSAELNKLVRGITVEAADLLTAHSWPGNLRELKNVIRRAALLTTGNVIDRDCIQFLIAEERQGRQLASFTTLRESVKELEKKMIREALEKTGGNKAKAAELLDVSYTSLFSKIKDYDIK
jgi:DNA-binding NtrC family response regulator